MYIFWFSYLTLIVFAFYRGYQKEIKNNLQVQKEAWEEYSNCFEYPDYALRLKARYDIRALGAQVAKNAGIPTPLLIFPIDNLDSMFVDFNGKEHYIVLFPEYLLEKKESMEGLIAHEMAHIVNGSIYPYAMYAGRGIANCVYVSFLFAFGFVLFGRPDLTTLIVLSVLFVSFGILSLMEGVIKSIISRHEEYEADKKALALTSHPWSLVDWMENYAEEEDKEAEALTRFEKWFLCIISSHPEARKRAEALKKELEGLHIERPRKV